MPNRTVYLPDDVDELARRHGLRLSELIQDAIRREAAARAAAEDERSSTLTDDELARLRRARERARDAGIHYPDGWLDDERRSSGDDLR